MQIITTFTRPFGGGDHVHALVAMGFFFQLQAGPETDLCILSSLQRFVAMRLRSLCEVLLLLCLCAVPCLAASRAHQPRKVDRIARTYLHAVAVSCLGESRLPVDTEGQSLGQMLARRNPWPSKPPLGPKAVLASRGIVPRKLARRNTFCRPQLCGSGEHCLSISSRKYLVNPENIVQ